MGLVVVKKKFQNMHLFQESGDRFFNYGYYTDSPEGTAEWRNYWKDDRDWET